MKWIGIALGGLVALPLATAGIAFAWTEAQFNRTYHIQTEMLVIPSDEVAITRGRHLEDAILDCTLCHGEDLGGGLLLLAAILFANRSGDGGGTPSLSVDQQKIDYGYVKYGETRSFAVQVTNTGDGTLRFKEQPYIEVLEGC